MSLKPDILCPHLLYKDCMKKIAIVQSNYIPWKGYFDLIASVDELILYDDMQYTRRDWRNRNKIKTPQGLIWLTVPVQVKGKYFQSIRDTRIDGTDWQQNHYRSLVQNYRKAKYFEWVDAWLKPLYLDRRYETLSELNRLFLETIMEKLHIKTTLKWSWEYNLVEGKTERLCGLVLQAKGDAYLSGPAAKAYIDSKVFEDAGVKLEWFDYHGYKVYPQLHGAFEHGVTVLDVLYNCGPDASNVFRKDHGFRNA